MASSLYIDILIYELSYQLDDDDLIIGASCVVIGV